jgi:hypothetical protein
MYNVCVSAFHLKKLRHALAVVVPHNGCRDMCFGIGPALSRFLLRFVCQLHSGWLEGFACARLQAPFPRSMHLEVSAAVSLSQHHSDKRENRPRNAPRLLFRPKLLNTHQSCKYELCVTFLARMHAATAHKCVTGRRPRLVLAWPQNSRSSPLQ